MKLSDDKKTTWLLLLLILAVAATSYPPSPEKVPTANVRLLGALGGVNNDTAVFQSALNNGGAVFVPFTTNYTSTTLKVTNNTYFYSYGAKISALNTMSYAALVDWTYSGGSGNTNIVMYGLTLDGGAYVGPAGGANNGVTNRIGIQPYAYGQANEIYACTILGFDFGIKPLGDKTTTTSHQSSTLNLHDITCYSNFCGVYMTSPDATHVVEYVTCYHINAELNFIGIDIDSGNINLLGCDLNNNGYGVTVPGTGVNNSHGAITGCKINHNVTAAFGFTNVVTGELISDCEIQSSQNCYFQACQGLNIVANQFGVIYLWFVGGSSTHPNFLTANTFNATYSGGGGFTPINTDGSLVSFWNNSGSDLSGDPTFRISPHEVTLTESAATTLFTVSLATGKSITLHVIVQTRANDATDFQDRSDEFVVACVNKAGTITTAVSASTTAAALSAGTLTCTYTIVDNTGGVFAVKNNAVSSLTQTTLVSKWRAQAEGNDLIATIITPQ